MYDRIEKVPTIERWNQLNTNFKANLSSAISVGIQFDKLTKKQKKCITLFPTLKEFSDSTSFDIKANNIANLNTQLQSAMAWPIENKGFLGIIQNLENNTDFTKLTTEVSNNIISNAIKLMKNNKKNEQIEGTTTYTRLIDNIIENVFEKAQKGTAADIIYTAALAKEIVYYTNFEHIKQNDAISTLKLIEDLVRVNNPIGADALKAFGIALVIGTTCFLLAPLVLHVGVSGAIALGALKLFHSMMLSKIAVSAVPALATGAVSFGLFRINAAHGNKAGANAIKDFKNWVLKI